MQDDRRVELLALSRLWRRLERGAPGGRPQRVAALVAPAKRAMAAEDFAPIEAALRSVDKFAARLPAGDAEDHVRRSVDELRLAFTTRAAVEPPVDRLLRSLRHSSCSARLFSAVSTEFLPALRRVGFEV